MHLMLKNPYIQIACLFLTVCAIYSGITIAFAVETNRDSLQPHKALYKISLVEAKSGAQIVNVSGDMYYEMTMTCDAWLTDHRFNLRYEYADAPSIQVKSNFATYESFDGKDFNFTSTRRRNGVIYEEIQGYAVLGPDGGQAVYKNPEGVTFQLPKNTRFPMRHTLDLLAEAKKRKRFFNSTVFDGSDDEGPVEINAFIGETVNVIAGMEAAPKIDMTLLNTPAREMRLAFFPLNEVNAQADYEMEMHFHDNGVVSNMVVEYQTFSIEQDLIALEKLSSPKCGLDK